MAVAAALAAQGAAVTLVTGPTAEPAPEGVETVRVETAGEMLAAVDAAPRADVAVFAAAVADWRVAEAGAQKMKKDGAGAPPALTFVENPDILATVARWPAGRRPALVIGFAAETETVEAHAVAKRRRKGCDWIVANDVSEAGGVMGGPDTAAILVTDAGVERWPRMSKRATADRLAARVADWFAARQADA
jgi:phosphopantothenoylcysteine decarboxylase/phosphopantothenate--cysteine ligase